MKKNELQTISINDLDLLMKQAFLELDFNQDQNQLMLESVSKSVFSKINLFTLLIKKVVLHKFLFLIGFILITGGFLLEFKSPKPITETKLPAKESVFQKNNFTEDIKKEELLQLKIPDNKNVNPHNGIRKAVLPFIEKNAVISGYIKSSKNGDRLSGVAVYEPKLSIGVSSDERGYYSLSLPKGEHLIDILLPGYQTISFSVYLDGNVTKNIDLQEVLKQLDEVVVKPKEYVFPYLTEKQKKANEKEKQKMAKLAAKLKPGKDLNYSFIPEPTDKSFRSFYIGSGEVTNLEYRTFLFDLLIQGRKDEFLLAKPEQNLWMNAGGVHFFDTLSHIYFADKRYNIYPVVNISLLGAEMYCKWLSGLVNEIRQRESKPPIEVRLPYEKEWRHASNGGHPDAVYAWPSDSIQNRANWFLANFCIQKQADKLKYPLGHPDKFDQTAYTSAGIAMYGTVKHKIATIETWSYNANDFYLYNVCGNVSEMVYADERKNLKAKGGNWNSDFEHLKFNNDNEFDYKVEPSPMIGFRVCIVTNK